MTKKTITKPTKKVGPPTPNDPAGDGSLGAGVPPWRKPKKKGK